MKKLLLLLSVFICLQANAQCFKQIETTGSHFAAIDAEGRLLSWGEKVIGYNRYGLDYKWDRSPKLLSGDTNWKKISLSRFITFALKSDGTLWGVGYSNYYHFGNNEYSAYLTTLQQINNDNDWADINATDDYVMAIKTDGTLWTWGLDPINPGVEGNYNMNKIPTQIGTDTNWKMAIGKTAIKTNGTLWQNGTDGYVQLGTATDWDKAWTDRAVTKTDGTLYIWGNNMYGQLGNGTTSTVPVNTPTQVGTDTWKMVAGNPDYSIMGVKTDGTLWGWGKGDVLFGLATASTITTPIQIGTDADWATVSYSSNAFGLKTDGVFTAWSLPYLEWFWPHYTISTENVSIPTEIQNCDASLGTTENTLLQLTLYPNPTANILYLANAENLAIENILVNDLSGKTVLSQKGNIPQLNVSQLPNGMYFVNITANTGTANLKFIKE